MVKDKGRVEEKCSRELSYSPHNLHEYYCVSGVNYVQAEYPVINDGIKA